MNKTLYLFRHGETDWNLEGRFQGHIDVPLNLNGKRQASKLRYLVESENVEVILSSDLNRAYETANILTEKIKIPIFTDARLREAYLGLAQGLTTQEIETRYGKSAIQKWRSAIASDADFSYPEGETGKEVLNRSLLCIQEFCHQKPFQKIGISTHGGVIRRIIQNLLPPDSPPVPIPNTVVYVLDYHLEMRQLTLNTLSRDKV